MVDFISVLAALIIVAVICLFSIHGLKTDGRLKTKHFWILCVNGCFAFTLMIAAAYFVTPVPGVHMTMLITTTIAFICFLIVIGEKMYEKAELSSGALLLILGIGQWLYVITIMATPEITRHILVIMSVIPKYLH